MIQIFLIQGKSITHINSQLATECEAFPRNTKFRILSVELLDCWECCIEVTLPDLTTQEIDKSSKDCICDWKGENFIEHPDCSIHTKDSLARPFRLGIPGIPSNDQY